MENQEKEYQALFDEIIGTGEAFTTTCDTLVAGLEAFNKATEALLASLNKLDAFVGQYPKILDSPMGDREKERADAFARNYTEGATRFAREFPEAFKNTLALYLQIREQVKKSFMGRNFDSKDLRDLAEQFGLS